MIFQTVCIQFSLSLSLRYERPRKSILMEWITRFEKDTERECCLANDLCNTILYTDRCTCFFECLLKYFPFWDEITADVQCTFWCFSDLWKGEKKKHIHTNYFSEILEFIVVRIDRQLHKIKCIQKVNQRKNIATLFSLNFANQSIFSSSFKECFFLHIWQSFSFQLGLNWIWHLAFSKRLTFHYWITET